MTIEVRTLSDVEPRPRHVAVGVFDGVHLGHREVIDAADTVLTFEPHPVRIIHPEVAPKLITRFPIKRDLIAGLGVSELVVIPFDRRFASLEAEEFHSSVLLDALGAERVSVGENFRFGARARGTPEMLASRGGFETRVVPLVEVDGEAISSSRVRALIAAGEVEAASRCLGAPFLFEGEVGEGDRRGRTLGFPTANIVPDDSLAVPGHGIYAALANGRPAAVNVGVRPTFETGRGLLVEAYLIDYEGDLYGQTLRIAFIARLRGERRFAGPDELVEQMRLDVEEARRHCASFSPPPGLAEVWRSAS
jgi:riboflavin kinase/FMN adenylyltransferase